MLRATEPPTFKTWTYGPALTSVKAGPFCFCKSEQKAAQVFKKGQSGNPAGRPKGEKLLTPMLRRTLGEKVPGESYTWGSVVVMALLTQAKDGDINAIKTIIERIDGKVLDQVDLTSAGESFSFLIQGRRSDEA